MTTLEFRPPVMLPLHSADWQRPAGNTDFRVTQRFADRDAFYRDGRMHQATDIGNFSCGAVVVAMAPGRARRVHDNARALGAKTDALGVIVDHGHGIESAVWHLNRQDASDGQVVTAGQQIGIVGRTGLGDVCHAHIEVKRNGNKIDPEPLMFGGSLTVEDDMRLPTNLKTMVKGVVGPGNRIRRDPDTTDGSWITNEVITVQVFGDDVRGESYTLGGRTSDEYLWIGKNAETWYIAKPLVTGLELSGHALTLPAADCSAQEASIAQLRTKIARAATAANGAAQALNATVVALR